MSRPWWLFYGVARETPRMIYEPPLVRIARIMRTTIDAYTQLGRQLSEQLLPVFQKLGKAYADVGRALVGEPPR